MARVKFYLLFKCANVAKNLDIWKVLFHKIYELAANFAARKYVAWHDKNLEGEYKINYKCNVHRNLVVSFTVFIK